MFVFVFKFYVCAKQMVSKTINQKENTFLLTKPTGGYVRGIV